MSSMQVKVCLVCGVETKNRCSSCAKAGIDLFFCSADHQALVWKSHRRVCGPGKANPFTWPLLSKSEANEILKHMHETTGKLVTAAPGRKTVASGFCLDAGLFPENVKPVIEFLTIGGPSHVLPLELQQRMLLSLRAHEYARVTRDGLRPSLTVPTNVINHLANYDMFGARLRPPGDAPEQAWRLRYRHEMLVLMHLVVEIRSYLPGTPPSDLGDFVQYNRARNRDTIATTIAEADLALAEKMMRSLREGYAAARSMDSPLPPD